MRVVVVNDGSSDGAGDVAQGFAGREAVPDGPQGIIVTMGAEQGVALLSGTNAGV